MLFLFINLLSRYYFKIFLHQRCCSLRVNVLYSRFLLTSPNIYTFVYVLSVWLLNLHPKNNTISSSVLDDPSYSAQEHTRRVSLWSRTWSQFKLPSEVVPPWNVWSMCFGLTSQHIAVHIRTVTEAMTTITL